MRIVPPVLLACLVLAAPAPAALSPRFVDENLMCFSATSSAFRLLGLVRLEADGGYAFDDAYLEDAGSDGTWDPATGAIARGPLERTTAMDAPPGTTMPGDQKPGRVWPVVLEHPDTRAAYCRPLAAAARAAMRPIERYVERVSGLDLAVPRIVDRNQLMSQSDGTPMTTVFGRVRAAGPGFWRVDLVGGPCGKGRYCDREAILSARRAPLRHMAFKYGSMLRFNRTLARGARGWEGSIGCAFGSSPLAWGPMFCGQTVIVWRYRGVNYCIEGHGIPEGTLVRMANEAIRSLPRTDISRGTPG